MEKALFEFDRTVQLHQPPLIVSWVTQDVGKLHSKGIEPLIDQLGGVQVGRLNPVGFFSFGGVRFRENLVQIQESTFWALEEQNLLIFKSDEPEFEHYRFLNLLLDIAIHRFQVKALYTINAMLTSTIHTQARKIWAVFNQKELREEAEGAGLERMTWEGPPALSSYLLWLAKRRRLPAMSLWLEVPFYFGSREDYRAIKSFLSFLIQRFGLSLDFREMDAKIDQQEERIARLRQENEEVDRSLSRLERGLELDKEEQLKLTQAIYGLFWD